MKVALSAIRLALLLVASFLLLAVAGPAQTPGSSSLQPSGNNEGQLVRGRGSTTFSFTGIDYPRAMQTRALGINSAGIVVGSFDDREGTHGFVLHDEKFSSIDVPGATSTQARAINAREEIVGYSTDADGNLHGFFFCKGHFRVVDIAFSTETRAEGINDAGVISGEYVDGVDNEHGFLLRDKEFTSFDVPGSDSTDIWMVASDGEFVGDFDDGVTVLGFLRRKHGGLVTLQFPGSLDTAARWINKRNEIVGRWDDNSIPLQVPCTTQCHGFLWFQNNFISIDFPGALSTVALGVNNRGHVVGTYVDAAGNQRGYEARSREDDSEK
jgi:probable HAF family extracellular repeat protein